MVEIILLELDVESISKAPEFAVKLLEQLELSLLAVLLLVVVEMLELATGLSFILSNGIAGGD